MDQASKPTSKPDRFVFKQPSEAVLLEREEALRLRRLKENEKQMHMQMKMEEL